MTLSNLDRWATWREIQSQPGIWTEWAAAGEIETVRNWILAQEADEIWLSGAGTSAYIGDMIVAGLEGRSDVRLRSVSTTELVERPQRYLAGKNPLVINFGRSGSSAESIGILDALDALAPNAPRLNITCNAESVLATRKGKGPQHVVCLPEATHDAGFAMTSSFSTMLLTALGALAGEDAGAMITRLAGELPKVLEQVTNMADEGEMPKRMVFVGSGPLAFAARESALKVLELTAGDIPSIWDSTLGFRHGPKSFVTDDTHIVLFRSGEEPTARYDADLASELREQFPNARMTSVGPGGDIGFDAYPQDVWATPLMVAVGQVLGTVFAERMGLNVDNPFEGRGTLTRVVSGVKLYPVAA